MSDSKPPLFNSFFPPVPIKYETEEQKLLRMFIYRYRAELSIALNQTTKDSPRREVLQAQLDALENVQNVMEGLEEEGLKYF